MRINMTRIGNRLSNKVPRVRFLRSWRGYPAGAVIAPPGGLRQILLQAHDQLGNKVAELVDEPSDEQQAEEAQLQTEAQLRSDLKNAEGETEEQDKSKKKSRKEAK
jgi:hypothetical protein